MRVYGSVLSRERRRVNLTSLQNPAAEKINLEAVRDAVVSLRPPSPLRRIPRVRREVHVALSNRARAGGGRGAATLPRAWG